MTLDEAIAILSDMKIDIPVPKAAVTQKKRNVALDMAINALNCSEIPNSSDSISRQAAIDALDCINGIEEVLRSIPSTQPDLSEYSDNLWKSAYERGKAEAEAERKQGKWESTGWWGRIHKCDQCGNMLDFDGVNAGRGDANFCPNCGADMRGKE